MDKAHTRKYMKIFPRYDQVYCKCLSYMLYIFSIQLNEYNWHVTQTFVYNVSTTFNTAF